MSAQHVRVYMVEDSPQVTTALGELIESAGAEVVGHAETASQAIADIAKLHPDAVTIDVSLKSGTGFDVLEALAINDEHPPIRIMLTNYVSEAYRQAAAQLGADYFFDKAREVMQLLSVLAAYRAPAAGPA